MACGVWSAIAGNFPAHPHEAEGVLDRALERGRELGDRPFGNVDSDFLRHGHKVVAIAAFVCPAAKPERASGVIAGEICYDTGPILPIRQPSSAHPGTH